MNELRQPMQLMYESPSAPTRPRRFNAPHVWIAASLWATFVLLTLSILLSPTRRSQSTTSQIVMTAAAVVAGPMTGATARGFQTCCLRFSLALLPWCGGALALAIVTQFIVPPTRPVLRWLRIGVWTIGLLVWFGGGIISFAHAMS